MARQSWDWRTFTWKLHQGQIEPSLVTAVGLILVALAAESHFGERFAGPRCFHGLAFMATIGAVLGSVIGVGLGMVRRHRE